MEKEPIENNMVYTHEQVQELYLAAKEALQLLAATYEVVPFDFCTRNVRGKRHLKSKIKQLDRTIVGWQSGYVAES